MAFTFWITTDPLYSDTLVFRSRYGTHQMAFTFWITTDPLYSRLI